MYKQMAHTNFTIISIIIIKTFLLNCCLRSTNKITKIYRYIYVMYVCMLDVFINVLHVCIYILGYCIYCIYVNVCGTQGHFEFLSA